MDIAQYYHQISVITWQSYSSTTPEGTYIDGYANVPLVAAIFFILMFGLFFKVLYGRNSNN